MARRFVFVEEVEKLLADGLTELKLPEGTRFSAAAADLIKAKGIKISHTQGTDTGSASSEKSKDELDGTKASPAESVHSRIAVASEGQEITDPVAAIAGRSPYFQIFDHQGGLIETLPNPHRDTGGGAGPLVADLLAGKGVISMVAGNFGVNIRASLREKQIDPIPFSGRVKEAVNTALNRPS